MHGVPVATQPVTFTTTGTNSDWHKGFDTNGNAVIIPFAIIPQKWAIQVSGFNSSGVLTAPSVWDVLLLGSLDGVTFNDGSKLLEHVNGTNINGDTVWQGANFLPTRYCAVKCKSLTLGSASKIVVWFLGVE
jgi:hypothetical protein